MNRCLQLAAKGFPAAMPNPMVGCVIVHQNDIIGEGFHHAYGLPHAEVNAIKSVKNKSLLKTSTLYVNLEPCSHYGKTPPCTDQILQHKIPQVIVASTDPNPQVAGEGISKLLQAGIQVDSGIMEVESRELNARYYTFHEKKRPYVILKLAKSQDGFMSSIDDKQVWISNEYSRLLVHKWRGEEQAILIGSHTARIDNPQLNNRFDQNPDPLRIVIDQNLALSNNLHLFDRSVPTLVINEKKTLEEKNLEYVQMKFDSSLTKQIFDYLFKKSIQSIIIEGGPFTLDSFIQQNIWDEARVFIAPFDIVNGKKAPSIPAPVEKKLDIKGDQLLIYRNQANE